jgi:hypothetical protein
MAAEPKKVPALQQYKGASLASFFSFLLTPPLSEQIEARDTHIRESWVRAMELRLIRDEMNKCQRAEGVNHYENCKVFVDKYLELLRDAKVCLFQGVSEFSFSPDFPGISTR